MFALRAPFQLLVLHYRVHAVQCYRSTLSLLWYIRNDQLFVQKDIHSLQIFPPISTRTVLVYPEVGNCGALTFTSISVYMPRCAFQVFLLSSVSGKEVMKNDFIPFAVGTENISYTRA